MVRETRHLWVGNLPDNIREDRIREHFKRYGRVQNVKLLGRTESAGAVTSTVACSGVCATVAFMDIKSASKAHNAEHVLDERTLTTEYYEPAAIPSAAGAPSAGSSPAGSGYSGSSSSVNSAPAPTPSRYLLSGGEESTGTPCAAASAAAPATWRGTNDSATEFCRRGNTPAAYGRYQRNNSSAPYSTPPSNVDRTPHHRWYASGERGGGESTPSTPGGGEGGARRRRRSGSGGGSSRSDTSSPEPSDESRSSTPPGPPPAGQPLANNHRPQHPHQRTSTTASGRPLAICVRNLPTRSTDSSLKDGLYHEYKKHGKVVWVKVVGQNADRYAVVRFKKPSDVEKALEESQDKHFFGCKISVAPHQSCDEDAESAKPYETDIDEYHPKATRTLFIGNLEKDVTQQQLRDKFKHFGRIIEIDIKKGSGGGAGYAFCQYASISSVVEAIRAMDGEYVGSSRVKLGFGKPVATTCVWVDGLTEHTEKQVLGAVSRCGAATSVCVDRAAGAALVHFEQACAASAAVRELRRVAACATAAEPDHPRLCVDYASRECQEAFYEQLEKHGGTAPVAAIERAAADPAARYLPPARHDPLRYEGGSRSRASSYGRGSSRTPRYSAVEHYDPAEYAADRRYRVYEELGSSPQTEETTYDERLQSVVMSPLRSRRHRRDSSPEDHLKLSKEWHRSVSGGVVSVSGTRLTGEGRHRSRSGSRRRHRRRRDESQSRGGTPLRDEPAEAAPAEPRRPPLPRDRSVPMSLPLPKFAVLLRSQIAAAPPPPPAPPPAPASPARHLERPPSASSSSGGSAPHSPSLSLEERIRSLDEKYERWSRLELPAPPPDRARLRHRLLEVDINEVKPSEVVRSLLAKRSVFDEDSERLEGTARPPSPGARPRSLQYPFPTHPQPLDGDERLDRLDRVPLNGIAAKLHRDYELFRSERKSVECTNVVKSAELDDRLARTLSRTDSSDKPIDPRLNRVDRSISIERLNKTSESDFKLDSRIRLRTPSTDKLLPDSVDKKLSPKPEKDLQLDHCGDEHEKDRRRRLSVYSDKDYERPPEPPPIKMEGIEPTDDTVRPPEIKHNDFVCRPFSVKIERSDSFDCHSNKTIPTILAESAEKRDDVDVKNELKVDIVPEEKPSQSEQSQNISIQEINRKEEIALEQEKINKANAMDEEIAKICMFHSSQDETKPFDVDFLSIPDSTKSSNSDSKHDLPSEVVHNHLKDMTSSEDEKNKLNINTKKSKNEHFDLNHDFLKSDKNGKERYNQNMMITVFQNAQLEKENIQFEKPDKDRFGNYNHTSSEKRAIVDNEKNHEEGFKVDREKNRHYKDRTDKEKHDHERERARSNKCDREKNNEKEKNAEKERISEKEREKNIERDMTGDKEKNLERDKNSERERNAERERVPERDNEREKNDEKDKNAERERTTEKEKNTEKDKVADKEKNSEKDKKQKESSPDGPNAVKVEKSKYDKEHTKSDRDSERSHRDKSERDAEKSRHSDDKPRHSDDKSRHSDDKSRHSDDKSRHDHHRKDKYDKRKDSDSTDSKTKKDEKYKHDRHKKDHSDSKRDTKKELDSKSRKSSRDESTRDLCRKDSTDSSTSRASFDSSKPKEIDITDAKEDPKSKHKSGSENIKHKSDKEHSPKSSDRIKTEDAIKIKTDIKEEKGLMEQPAKVKNEPLTDHHTKSKNDTMEIKRHYSVDSPSLDVKRKERLNSCSSLPSHIGHKRRMSSQDSLESFSEENKKSKSDSKAPERRDSKDSRSTERHKTTKFNKGHFAKLLESKTKDEKKNQVKPPDDNAAEFKDEGNKDYKAAEKFNKCKKSPSEENEDNLHASPENKPESICNDLDFLTTLELRSSEEDEKQRALKKEMKEKKRIQQLQQIQELQLQQDAMQQAEYMSKIKDDKNKKCDDKRKEAAREKRMSTDRKSKDEKCDGKRRNRKSLHSSDSSDSDGPKKHSIFDIVDDEPTYISMYDKVKARSCKNMQKQEEEKRQEKIKAKFSQLKQSRAKREEKKRSSWDEDSDTDNDRKKSQKTSMDSSSEDDRHHQSMKSDKLPEFDDRSQKEDYFPIGEESRNKLSRKNSRSRIMSDTSDDDTLKRLLEKGPAFSQIKKEIFSDTESMQAESQTSGFFSKTDTDNVLHPKESTSDRMKKNSLLNLFGKSDSDDSKIKSCSGDNDHMFKSSYAKKFNDFSSESESMVSNVYSGEIRKKHKKKQRRNKPALSDEEHTNNVNDSMATDTDIKHRHSEKSRRHSTKKEKRRDKIRESIDTDESRDDRLKGKKNKALINSAIEALEAGMNNMKKDGKMEDIFGPLSDESDSLPKIITDEKHEFINNEYDSHFNISNVSKIEDFKLKEKEDMRRKKEKRRKEKRQFIKDDDNSLDVDAVGKAIEARLFADAITDDERPKVETPLEQTAKHDHGSFTYSGDTSALSGFGEEKKNHHHDKTKRNHDNRDKKKKKKRSKEDRQNRKDYHHFHHHDKCDEPKSTMPTIDLFPKEVKPIENVDLTDSKITKPVDKLKDDKSIIESPSLPRLTENPPVTPVKNNIEADIHNNTSDTSDGLIIVESMDMSYDDSKDIETIKIPSTPPPMELSSEVPTSTPEKSKADSLISPFGTDNDQTLSENAVRSISNLEKNTSKTSDTIDTPKTDEKIDEKPRAVISQEETEDAVAALLGESFGGNEEDFPFHEVSDHSTNQMESTTNENENMPEEDAEEMRRAVQNLNASEMEIKPDTPLSDNDLLLIDTDTEEAEELPQDALEKLPINIIATNPTLNSEQQKVPVCSKLKLDETPKVSTLMSTADIRNKPTDKELKLSPIKTVHAATSTATPVITSWTLTNNKLRETQLMNISKGMVTSRETMDNKPMNVTTNIIQLKAQPNHMVPTNSGIMRPIIGTPNRINAPYQVINQLRAQVPNMQPPTIKIPEPHILYQKQQSIVISPRMPNDPRLQSPKGISQSEPMTSPRLTNMAILSTSPQNLNSVGMTSPNNMQQRSPGHLTVVRMQQPPLSPIQGVHLPHGPRAMVSPNRPNSVLVQTQGAPLHFNRLPVAPVLAPISKQLPINDIGQPNKTLRVVTSSMLHPQKNIPADRRTEVQRTIVETSTESSKIILSPTSLHQTTNATVMAQNRLISMQNALHVGSLNTTLKLSNKVLLNSVSPLAEMKDIPNAPFKQDIKKSEHHNHISQFGSSPVIHVAGMNHTGGHILQTKPMMVHEPPISTREQGSNVIHSINSQRLPTTTSKSNIIQIDAHKLPSVLSMSTMRSPTVLTKLESSGAIAATTSTLTNVVMTPLLLKTNNTLATVRINNKPEAENHPSVLLQNKLIRENEEKVFDNKIPGVYDPIDRRKELLIKPVKPPTPPLNALKRETDFEELLKNNTSEIKVTPEKKLEVNVGQTSGIDATLPAQAQASESTPVSSHSTTKRESDKPVTEVISKVVAQSSNVTKDDNTTQEPAKDKLFNEVAFNEFAKQEIKHLSEKEPFKKAEEKEIVDNSSAKDDDKPLAALLLEQSDKKNNDEGDSWTAKDVNIESVIKKVDSLCNDNSEDGMDETKISVKPANNVDNSDIAKPLDTMTNTEEIMDTSDEFTTEKGVAAKRGGRNTRGKKANKNQDRVQTRQIAKPARGGTAKRGGRGRANVDKKLKTAINASTNNLPGDVYDFHEDSGDETNASSTNKAEARPRLILTIKSPLAGQTTAISSSTITIPPKELPKPQEPSKALASVTNKEEKLEEFVSPSANTRKSRRLQEKDVQRSTVDDVIEDVVKGTSTQTRGAKDNKRKNARQAGAKVNAQGAEGRKTARGVKRTRDRSLSDASIDSSDEKLQAKKEETPKDAKVPKLVETTPVSVANPTPATAPPPPTPPPPKAEPEALSPQLLPPPAVKPASTAAVISALPAAPSPMPIMKPPKKMISEISAKLASAFEATASTAPTIRPNASPVVPEKIVEVEPTASKVAAEADEMCKVYREARKPEFAKAHPIADELMPAATAEAHTEAGFRRLLDAAPGNALPVGALEAADARVQSPALPHRPPSIPSLHRPADRATPVLIRAGEGASGYRAAYAGTASLPRGAHHPPPPQPPHPAHPHLKPIAVPGPHHHHLPVSAGARMNVTSVPNISPQGHMPVGDGMYPHFSHQHYQMYQQHFRATQQESRASPLPYTRTLEAEGSEAPTPPLELRRPPTARVPRPAHSPAPPDRLIMYGVVGGRSPPPAHAGRPPSALPPPGPAGPPHASQVPREADSLQMLLQRYPVMWQGLLALKNDSAAVQMHFVGGNPAVAGDTLPRHTDGSTPPLRIAQRMRLEPAQLDQVHRKMKLENEHCMLLALPCGRDHMDVLQQSTNLTGGFITYLQRKQAAGIVNVAPPGHDQAMYTVHIFPSCEFANENLNRIAPDLMHRVAEIAHLLIVIATV